MEEVVYQFLLQTAGYPRAAIVSDTSVLFPDTDNRPAYVVVDPDNAQPLAVVHVVGAVDAAGLYAESATADTNKKALQPAAVQGFVVRIDFKGKTDREKIQFYRAKEKGELYPLTASNFPDLGSLRVAAKLRNPKVAVSNSTSNVHVLPTAHASAAKSSPQLSAAEFAKLPYEEREILQGREDFVPPVDDPKTTKKGRGHIWLGLLLIVLAVADAAASKLLGQPFLELTHVLLIVGAVLAFVLG